MCLRSFLVFFLNPTARVARRVKIAGLKSESDDIKPLGLGGLDTKLSHARARIYIMYIY